MQAGHFMGWRLGVNRLMDETREKSCPNRHSEIRIQHFFHLCTFHLTDHPCCRNDEAELIK
jgi:hypothetical protein